jgi:hypothetical protein
VARKRVTYLRPSSARSGAAPRQDWGHQGKGLTASAAGPFPYCCSRRFTGWPETPSPLGRFRGSVFDGRGVTPDPLSKPDGYSARRAATPLVDKDIGADLVAHLVGVPACAPQLLLHRAGAVMSGLFGQLLAVLALDPGQKPEHERPCRRPGFNAPEPARDAGHGVPRRARPRSLTPRAEPSRTSYPQQLAACDTAKERVHAARQHLVVKQVSRPLVVESVTRPPRCERPTPAGTRTHRVAARPRVRR